jgi:glycerate dehydrogenase
MTNSRLNIAFLDALTLGEVNLSGLEELGNLTCYEMTPPEKVIQRLKGIQVAITNKVIIDREIMEACPDLKLICIAATGMNNIDLASAKEKGIEVKNVAGYSTDSVAQSVFAMLFYLLHRSRYFDEYVKSGAYLSSPVFTHHGRSFWELKNKRFGIIGLGTIGHRVAEIAGAFGAEVVYHSTSGKNTGNDYLHLGLETLLSTSDVISVHCPLNEKTKDLIGAEQLRVMKPSAILLNMARGGIVNEKALSEALNRGWIAAAGVDVLTREPVLSDNPLLKVKDKEKIFITPHIAWTSVESRRLLVQKIIENIREFVHHLND